VHDHSVSLLLAAMGLLTGVAVAAEPGLGPVVQVPVDAGTAALLQLPVGQVTGPVALLAAGGLFGRLLGQLVNQLKGWRPHIIVEHRHIHVADPAAEGDR